MTDLNIHPAWTHPGEASGVSQSFEMMLFLFDAPTNSRGFRSLWEDIKGAPEVLDVSPDSWNYTIRQVAGNLKNPVDSFNPCALFVFRSISCDVCIITCHSVLLGDLLSSFDSGCSTMTCGAHAHTALVHQNGCGHVFESRCWFGRVLHRLQSYHICLKTAQCKCLMEA